MFSIHYSYKILLCPLRILNNDLLCYNADMQKSQKKQLKIVFCVSVFIIVLFMVIFKNNQSQSIQKSVSTKKTLSDESSFLKNNLANKNQVKKVKSVKKVQSKKSVKDIQKMNIKSDNSKLLILNGKSLYSKSISSKKSKLKTFKYSKRFIQIDQDLENYKILKDMFYIQNTKMNRSRFPKGIIYNDYILINLDVDLVRDSVLQNKNTGNYSLFNRVVKFKTKNDQGKLLLNKMKAYSYKNLNELSIVSDKYELKFARPEDALSAYSLFRNEPYVQWSSINVVEFVKID